MTVIVDSSVWIDYFRQAEKTEYLDFLIDENLVAVNHLILAEIVPFLKLRNQRRLIALLKTIYKFDISIDWDQLIDWQYQCLKKGLNGVGIPDLVIAQNTIQNNCLLYSLDQHFKMLQRIIGLKIIS